MRRLLLAFSLVAVQALTITSARAAVGAQLVAGGLDFPATFTFAPDGRIFYGERFSGEIRIRVLSTGQDTLFATLPSVATAGEQGLLGLALHPKYPTKGFVYAYYTRTVSGIPENQIVRLTDSGGTGTNLKTLVKFPAGAIHNGGVIGFGPDRSLYAVVGDVANPANAQNLSVDTGKVLRMSAGGAPARGNPFGTRVFSFGHRNMFGFDWDPQTRNLWVTGNGPECNDEIDIVLSGENHGWGPSQTCSTPPPAPQNTNQDGPSPVLPVVFYTPTIAPTGGAFCSNCGLGADTEGTFLFGAWNDGMIRRLTLTTNRLGVASQTVLYDHPSGVLALERAPNGQLYFSDATSIYRLIP